MVNLKELNEQQELAARTIDGPVLILAGAGSGKTRTITYRMAHMVQHLRIHPGNILAVSFTNKAAGEIKERVAKLAGSFLANKMTLCTFHSLCLMILKNDITLLGYRPKFSLYDTSDQMALIRQALKHYESDKSFDKNELQQKMSFLKNNGIGHEEFSKSTHFDPENPYDVCLDTVYRYYQEKLLFFNALDFDDLLLLTVKLFREHPYKALEYSNKFRYIMIDEYQDTNALQFELVLHLTKVHQNLCVVGDDDQSIYAWRGANVKHILDFEKHFPTAKIIKLEENYRSCGPILELANNVIVQNKKRRDKTLFTKIPGGNIPKLWVCSDATHQASSIADEIWKWLKNHYHLSHVAIIYRSNVLSQELEEALRLMNIPYKIIGGQKFFEKKEIKDLIGYLSIIHNVYDEMAFRRVINTPPRGVGPKTMQSFVALSNEKKQSIFTLLEEMEEESPGKEFPKLIRSFQEFFKENTLHESIKHLIDVIKLRDYIEKYYSTPKDVKRRLNDLDQFILSAQRFEEKYADKQRKKSILKLFLEKLLLVDVHDKITSEDEVDNKKDEVTLMTLHASKGLEFERVFLVGVEEDIMPHKKSIEAADDIEEERRLFYVGITRAKSELIMTHTKQKKAYGKVMPRHRSRFLYNINEKLWKNVDMTTFGNMAQEEIEQFQENFFDSIKKKLTQQQNTV